MAQETFSNFNVITYFLKIFGIWSENKPTLTYRLYSFTYLMITLYAYQTFLTLNLFFTPQKVDVVIPEVMFYFTEMATFSKAVIILIIGNKVKAVFEIMNCDPFTGDDEISRQIISKYMGYFKIYWKVYAILSNVDYILQIFPKVFLYLILGTNIELPICKYYFLSDEFRDKYFVYLYIYQSIGIYGHMTYNINIDALNAGLILMAIAQLKVLNHKLSNLKPGKNDLQGTANDVESVQILKLNKYLKHYDVILKYCSKIQDIMSMMMFIQFGLGSATICFSLCGLVFNPTVEVFISTILYLFLMTMQIFVPAWLGTSLSVESQSLVLAAYNSDWIQRSERFKRNIRIFVERANKPIILTGLALFPLTLGTFTSITKTAYSFFALLRNIQFRQEGHI